MSAPTSSYARPWVDRLGKYLRIFGPPAPCTFGYRTSEPYLDSLIAMAQRNEEQFARTAAEGEERT